MFRRSATKGVLLALLVIGVLFFPATSGHAEEETFSTGCLPPDPQQLQAHVDAEYLARLKTLSVPRSLDWSSGLPAPGDQGSQGSCTAWATGYALKTFQENQERHWGVDTPAHQVQPRVYLQPDQRWEGRGCLAK